MPRKKAHEAPWVASPRAQAAEEALADGFGQGERSTGVHSGEKLLSGRAWD